MLNQVCPPPQWSLLCFSKVMCIVVVFFPPSNTLEGVFMMLLGCVTFSLVLVWIYSSQNEAALVGADKSSNCGSHFQPIWLPPSTGLTSSRLTGSSYLIHGPLLRLLQLRRYRYYIIYDKSCHILPHSHCTRSAWCVRMRWLLEC